jgi:hypothetical protein
VPFIGLSLGLATVFGSIDQAFHGTPIDAPPYFFVFGFRHQSSNQVLSVIPTFVCFARYRGASLVLSHTFLLGQQGVF